MGWMVLNSIVVATALSFGLFVIIVISTKSFAGLPHGCGYNHPKNWEG